MTEKSLKASVGRMDQTKLLFTASLLTHSRKGVIKQYPVMEVCLIETRS